MLNASKPKRGRCGLVFSLVISMLNLGGAGCGLVVLVLKKTYIERQLSMFG